MKNLSICDNGLHKARTVFAVELHPSTSANVLDGVKEQLNAHILRYVDEFDAVLISYSNIEVLTKKPVIHPYFPYFHLDVRADVLVFKPTPGMTLVGRVNHIGEDYISALVMGVFNVTIPARSVMQELQFLREESKWVHEKQPLHQIAEHSYIAFKVEEVRDHGGFFQITGSLRDPGNGAADFLHPGVKLPEPPTADWEADAVMEDGFAEPATTVGGAGAAAKANKEDGKQHGFAQQKGSADKAKALDSGMANGGSDHKDDKKRRRSSEVIEEPKGKRRRKEEKEKGGASTGPSENGDAAVPEAASKEAAGTSGNGVASCAAAAGLNSPKSNKKGKDGGSAGKGKKDKDGRHEPAGGQPQGKERDKEKRGDGGEKKVDKDKPKSAGKEKDKGPHTASQDLVIAVAPSAAPAYAGKTHGDEPGIAGEARANGEVNAFSGGKAKTVMKEKGKESRKEDKEKKDGKDSSKKDKKKEGKESSRKDKKDKEEGKESSKKDKAGKDSSKKDKDKEGKDSSKKDKDKEGKESSKKKKEEGGKVDGIKSLQENGDG